MKLSRKALSKMTTRAKNRLALELNRSGYTVERWIKDNDDNGPLTTAKALEIIGEETGLGKNDMLVSEVKESQK
jgi:hypothetical protein